MVGALPGQLQAANVLQSTAVMQNKTITFPPVEAPSAIATAAKTSEENGPATNHSSPTCSSNTLEPSLPEQKQGSIEPSDVEPNKAATTDTAEEHKFEGDEAASGVAVAAAETEVTELQE